MYNIKNYKQYTKNNEVNIRDLNLIYNSFFLR